MDDIHVDIGEKVKEEVSTLKTGLVNDVKAEIKSFLHNNRPVIQGKFCLHPLHVHLKFWDVSSLRACLSAREMFVHSEQNFSSHIQHDKCSTSSYIIFSHFGQAYTQNIHKINREALFM
jgi:hypothetical protein